MSPRPNLLARGLEGLAAFAVARPWRVLALGALLVAGSLGASLTWLDLKTSNLDLIDPEHPEVRAFRAFAREFGTPNALVVVLEGDETASLIDAGRRLLPLLNQGPGVASVLGKLPGPPAAFAALGRSPYLLARDGRMLFIFVQPADPESRAATIEPFVAGVRRALAKAGLPSPLVRAGTTGLPQYALDDRDAVARDITRLSGLSFVLVLALFAGAFASFWRPVLVMTCLAAATAVLMGLAALAPGYLTLLSSFFGSIVFGMGVDFGILVVDRLEEELARGLGRAAALLAAIHALAPGLATGALTTALGFFALEATGFRGFAELGWLAGWGILLSLLAMVTLLPALLMVVPQGARRERPAAERRIGRALNRLQHEGLAAGLVLAALLTLLAPGPGFDQDYLDLQPRGSEAVRLERAMAERSDASTQFAAFTTESAEAAAALTARLRREEVVGSVHSDADLALLRALGGGEAADLRARFVSPAGHHAVYAYPKGNAWDPATRDRFITRMRALDPAVTGMPFLGRAMIELSHRALWIAGSLAFVILVVCVFLDLRNLRLAALALLPTLAGLALMRGAMALFGISFNPLNLMALPVVIGIGEDNAVHLLHRLLEEGGDLRRALAGTGRSLVLTSGTTVASFVALSFAHHRGLASFAQVLALGVGATLAISLFALPQLASRLLKGGKFPRAAP